jgi:hypothetical protein
MKKALLFLFLLAALGGIVTAQEEPHKNVIYIGTTDIFGFATSYERIFRPDFSLIVDMGASLFFSQTYYTIVRTRYYPSFNSDGTRSGFFLSLGAGFGKLQKDDMMLFLWEKDPYEVNGFVLSPGIGIKIGNSKPTGFIFSVGMDLDLYIGEETIDGNKAETKIGVGLNPNCKLLFGFGF